MDHHVDLDHESRRIVVRQVGSHFEKLARDNATDAQEREAALLSELDLTKRAQAEAEHALARVQVALKQEQAQLLAAAQQAQHAAAEQEPLRQQVAPP